MSKLVTDYLFNEHKIITEMLGVLKKEMVSLREGKIPDQNRYQKIIQFFRDYADKSHHEKEEKILFQEIYLIQNIEAGPSCIFFKELQLQRPPVIFQIQEHLLQMKLDPQEIKNQWKSLTREGHIINPLLEEHILGRTLIKLIDFEVQQRLTNQTKDNKALLHAVYCYNSMLEEHIDKEDNCLSHTVEKYLPLEAQQKIVDRFKEMDEGPSRELIENSLDILEELKKSS